MFGRFLNPKLGDLYGSPMTEAERDALDNIIKDSQIKLQFAKLGFVLVDPGDVRTTATVPVLAKYQDTYAFRWAKVEKVEKDQKSPDGGLLIWFGDKVEWSPDIIVSKSWYSALREHPCQAVDTGLLRSWCKICDKNMEFDRNVGLYVRKDWK